MKTVAGLDRAGADFELGIEDELLDQLERFDLAWRNGTPPRIDAFLEALDAQGGAVSLDGHRSRLLAELVKIDMEYRWRGDESAARMGKGGPLLEHYLERFPELGPVERIPADLIGEEYRLRRRLGERLTHPDFLARFPGRDTELSALLSSIDTELAVERSAAARLDLPPREPLEPAAQGSRFQVVRPHLRGGLGQIFIARDLELDREVALKEIHDFHADRPDSRARFIREAEITGRLEHPGIVPVYGMGRNSEGRPFYAMRLIRGDTLGDAIRRYHAHEPPASHPVERALELRRLLGHFVTVCNTIAYAHSQGVLHRDLKPGNILLGPFGQTVVVDWGLAKLIGSRGPEVMESSVQTGDARPAADAETQPGQVMGTPSFMSPEQFAGDPGVLGPASDVYSLGATLYMLLAGRPAFHDIKPPLLAEKIKQGDFPPPRRFNREAPAALEAVCKKAMAPRPEDRYASARALASDVELWLGGEPVSAMSEPLAARARRWLAGHRTLVTAMAAAGMMALAGLSALVVIQKKANLTERAARRFAEDQSRLAMEAVQSYTTGVNHELLLNQPEMRELRGRLLQAPREFYLRYKANLERDGNLGPQAQAELAEACMNLGILTEEVGTLDDAAAVYRQALDMLKALPCGVPEGVTYQKWYADTLGRLAQVHALTGKPDEAESEFQQALAQAGELAARFPAVPDYRRMMINRVIQLGNLHYTTGKLDQAEEEYQGILERLPASGEAGAIASGDASATDRESRELRARCLSNLGRLYEAQGRYGRADRSFRESLSIRRQLADENRDSIKAAEDLASSLEELGHLDYLTGLHKRAEQSYRDSLAIRQSLARDHPNLALVRRGVAESWYHIGRITERLGRADEAREAYRAAAEILDRLVDDNPSSTHDRDWLFKARRGLGEIEFKAERLDRAETEFQAAFAALETSASAPDQTINMQVDRAAVEVRLGEIIRRRRRFDEAIERFNNAMFLAEAILSKEPKHVMARVCLYEAHVERALARSCQGKYILAMADWEKAMDYGKGHADTAEIRLRRAMELACARRLDEAERIADQVAADPATNLGLQYNCACVYARIIAVADQSQSSAAVALSPDALTARAVASLRKYLPSNPILDPDITRVLSTDPDLEPLCPQPLFQIFLMDLAFPEQPFAANDEGSQ